MRAARSAGFRARTSAATPWTGRCGCASSTTLRDVLRRTWTELFYLVRSARALTWPTASRMSGVARRMERLTRWPEP